MPIDSKTFIDRFAAELKKDNAALFVGAGLSKSAGYVDWIGLLAPLAAELKLDIGRESDLVALAQYYVNSKGGNRHQLSTHLISEFSDVREPTENHQIIARLPIRTIWTTNYDTLIESAFSASGKRVDVKHAKNQLNTTKPHRDLVLYKMHGDIEHVDEAILTKDDYEKYYRTHEPFITALSGALVSTTFCFLGFSFSDPNLHQVLSHVRVNFGQNQRAHYCVTKRVRRKDYDSQDRYEYALVKQELQIQDLLRFNIETVLIEEYSDLPKILDAIERKIRSKTVFVSGSAVEFGDDWPKPKVEEFLAKLARELVLKGFRITTGFGLGVGGPIVSGAMQAIYSRKNGTIDEHIVMRPFPIDIADDAERKSTFKRYREDMISQSGIAVFLFGNKSQDGKTVEADGLLEEFNIAKARGLWLLPVGATEYVARRLWTTVSSQYDSHLPKAPPPIQGLLQQLGKREEDPLSLVKPLVEAIELLGQT